jgi:hypothetical protein
MNEFTRYQAEIDIELTAQIGQYNFIDKGVLIVLFDHKGGIYHSGGIHPDDQPHEFDIIQAYIQWDNLTTTDAFNVLDVEEVLKANEDEWYTVWDLISGLCSTL